LPRLIATMITSRFYVDVILVITTEVNGDTESGKSVLRSLYQVEC